MVFQHSSSDPKTIYQVTKIKQKQFKWILENIWVSKNMLVGKVLDVRMWKPEFGSLVPMEKSGATQHPNSPRSEQAETRFLLLSQAKMASSRFSDEPCLKKTERTRIDAIHLWPQNSRGRGQPGPHSKFRASQARDLLGEGSWGGMEKGKGSGREGKTPVSGLHRCIHRWAHMCTQLYIHAHTTCTHRKY